METQTSTYKLDEVVVCKNRRDQRRLVQVVQVTGAENYQVKWIQNSGNYYSEVEGADIDLLRAEETKTVRTQEKKGVKLSWFAQGTRVCLVDLKAKKKAARKQLGAEATKKREIKAGRPAATAKKKKTGKKAQAAQKPTGSTAPKKRQRTETAAVKTVRRKKNQQKKKPIQKPKKNQQKKKPKKKPKKRAADSKKLEVGDAKELCAKLLKNDVSGWPETTAFYEQFASAQLLKLARHMRAEKAHKARRARACGCSLRACCCVVALRVPCCSTFSSTKPSTKPST